MDVKVVRSAKRRKTVEARVVDGVLVVRAPAAMGDGELERVIEGFQERLRKREAKKALDDEALEQQARALNRAYFEGKLSWKSIRWVTNQTTRFGSCTPAKGTIRVSHRVAEFPPFVRDYVIVHELAHLVEPGHDERFWALVNRYPRTERARGFLMAVGMEDVEE